MDTKKASRRLLFLVCRTRSKKAGHNGNRKKERADEKLLHHHDLAIYFSYQSRVGMLATPNDVGFVTKRCFHNDACCLCDDKSLNVVEIIIRC